METSSLFLRRLIGTTLALSAACLLSGCGKKFGSVTGTVTYKGKNLTGGSVAFAPEAKGAEVGTSSIDKDGKYSIPKVLVGKCKITVSTPIQMKVPGAGGRMMDAGKMGGTDGGKSKIAGEAGEAPTVKVPDKYGKADSSGLSFDVVEGANTHNITLTD